MDEKERVGLWVAIGVLATATIVQGVVLGKVRNRVCRLADVMMEHLDDEFQQLVDEQFEDIVDRFEE